MSDNTSTNLSSFLGDSRKTPNSNDLNELQATRFNFAKYQLQNKRHFQVQFLPSKYDSSLSIDPELRFMVVSFALPKETTEVNEINYFNQTVKVAGKTTYDTIPLVIRDSIGMDTERKFEEWRSRVYEAKTGKVGLAANYKLDVMVYEMTPNREYFRSWKCEGCFPSTIDYGDLSYEDGGEKQITVTLSMDRAYRDDLKWDPITKTYSDIVGTAPISNAESF
jgi:hypothetical protein